VPGAGLRRASRPVATDARGALPLSALLAGAPQMFVERAASLPDPARRAVDRLVADQEFLRPPQVPDTCSMNSRPKGRLDSSI